jgi:uncharacterized protein (UPF0276 family)
MRAGPFPPKASVSLGVGLDMAWGAERGFVKGASGKDVAAPPVLAYLERAADRFEHLFVSWQPRDRGRLDLRDYEDAYDHLFGALGTRYPVRALHHTALNLGALERYDRAELFDFTNALVRRYGFAWVNEDLGLWSLNGRPLPYPLPPWLTEGGLAAAIRNVREVVERLEIPLLVEFPGFSDGTSVYVGHLDAYDFFRALAEEAEVAVTLDIGHLLSWRWIRGFRGEDLFAELERLPLAHCAEIHLSGCALEGEAFLDYHHGVLLSEQLELLGHLLPRCPELRVVTYEDPRFDGFGDLLPETRAGHRALVERVGAWSRSAA